MNITDVTTLISSVGFPITCCCACFWYINTTMKEFTKTMQENTSMIEKLTLILTKEKD